MKYCLVLMRPAKVFGGVDLDKNYNLTCKTEGGKDGAKEMGKIN